MLQQLNALYRELVLQLKPPNFLHTERHDKHVEVFEPEQFKTSPLHVAPPRYRPQL